MIIEFIGTPGAGKTTLVPTVTEYFREQGIQACIVVDAARPYAQRTGMGKLVTRLAPQGWRLPLLWQVFYHLSTCYRLTFFFRHPRLIYQVLSRQLRRPIAMEERLHALHWFFHLVGYYQFLRAYEQSNEALIFDEGFVHRVVQMNASDREEPNAEHIGSYVNLVPRPDLTIAVHAPWELCLDRIYRRGLWQRYRAKSRAEVARYIANAHAIVKLTLDQIRSMGWTLIEIDNSCDGFAPDEELRRKLAALLPMPNSGSMPTKSRIRGWTE